MDYKTKKRQTRVRLKLKQVSDRPRLQVYRSNKYTYAQIIQKNGHILAAVSEKQIDKEGNKTEKAAQLGSLIAQKAIEKGVQKVVFDRGHFTYHGRIKALAQAAREKGLQL